ncbi:hypothetical protein KBD45_02375 [Candidatus Dojkabacteria bacterium]|nr:hypothetical protein [Candidatus Dojkabacteria bacterium]
MEKNFAFENPFLEMFQKVQAQGTNIVSPTLPVDISSLQPQEILTPTPPPSNKVNISLLISDNKPIRVNDKIKTYVAITSNDLAVQSFQITIEYDSKMVKFAAKDFLDANFEITENIIVNETKSTIIVEGTAKATPQAINSNVAFIEFLTIDKGSTTIKISNTNQDSQILNPEGNNILETVENLDLEIDEQLAATPIPGYSITITPTPKASSLPESSLDLNILSQFTPIGAGILVLIFGLWLKKLVSSKEDY